MISFFYWSSYVLSHHWNVETSNGLNIVELHYIHINIDLYSIWFSKLFTTCKYI